MESFYQGNRITKKNLNAHKKITSCIFQRMFGKNPVLKVLEDFQNNVFSEAVQSTTYNYTEN